MLSRLAVAAVVLIVGVASTFGADRQPSPTKVAAAIDASLASELFGTEPPDVAALADDSIFLRRVSLDITGQLPKPEDLDKFAAEVDDVKRERLVERLLARRDYGLNWGRYWRDVVMFRRGDDRGVIAYNSLQRYLTEALNNNEPWDEIATALITAEGDVLEDGRNGLIMAQLGQPEDVVAEISRIFLGIQIQCAQCHDHKTDRWTREQFHELAAFFPRVAARPDRSGERRTYLVTASDRPTFRSRLNNANRFRGTREHYMKDLENPQARGERMRPVFFLNDKRLSFGTPDAERRMLLARWVTAPETDWFAKAMVNRMWSELVGEGFYEPVDDMGPDRDATAPQTLSLLADAFTDSGYDVKWLMQTIMATEAYQRESRPRRAFNQTPMSANCQQPLRGDQLLNALAVALGIPDRAINGRGFRQGQRGYAQGDVRGQFNRLFGYDPSDPRDEVAGSIPQALMLMNGPQINRLIKASPFTPLGRLIRNTPDDEKVITELYLRSLARVPSDDERQKCVAYIEKVGDRDEAFEDILWALVNSAEFLHRR